MTKHYTLEEIKELLAKVDGKHTCDWSGPWSCEGCRARLLLIRDAPTIIAKLIEQVESLTQYSYDASKYGAEQHSRNAQLEGEYRRAVEIAADLTYEKLRVGQEQRWLKDEVKHLREQVEKLRAEQSEYIQGLWEKYSTDDDDGKPEAPHLLRKLDFFESELGYLCAERDQLRAECEAVTTLLNEAREERNHYARQVDELRAQIKQQYDAQVESDLAQETWRKELEATRNTTELDLIAENQDLRAENERLNALDDEAHALRNVVSYLSQAAIKEEIKYRQSLGIFRQRNAHPLELLREVDEWVTCRICYADRVVDQPHAPDCKLAQALGEGELVSAEEYAAANAWAAANSASPNAEDLVWAKQVASEIDVSPDGPDARSPSLLDVAVETGPLSVAAVLSQETAGNQPDIRGINCVCYKTVVSKETICGYCSRVLKPVPGTGDQCFWVREYKQPKCGAPGFTNKDEWCDACIKDGGA